MPAKLKGNSIDWITERIHEAKVKYRVQAVFVDHLHYLVDMSRHSISIEIGSVMRSIKKLALRFNVCFFLIAHTTKIRPDTELDLGDTRDSSFIEQEADNVFYIWRKPHRANEATLKIAKNRRYGVFNQKIPLIKIGHFLGELIS
jgi:replicative DNA helicase